MTEPREWANARTITECIDTVWLKFGLFYGAMVLIRAIRRPEVRWQEAIVVFLALAAAVTYSLDWRTAWSSKGRTWKWRSQENLYVTFVRIADGQLECETLKNGRRELFPHSRITLDKVWGIKPSEYGLKVIRVGDYSSPFTIPTSYFASFDDEAKFLDVMSTLGKNVIGRAKPPPAGAII